MLHQPRDEEGDLLRCQAPLRGRSMQVREGRDTVRGWQVLRQEQGSLLEWKVLPEGQDELWRRALLRRQGRLLRKDVLRRPRPRLRRRQVLPRRPRDRQREERTLLPARHRGIDPARDRFCCPKNDPDCCSDELTCLGDGLVCVRGICQKL